MWRILGAVLLLGTLVLLWNPIHNLNNIQEMIDKDPPIIKPMAEEREATMDPTNIHFIVNKERPLSVGFAPDDLVIPNIPFSFDGILDKSYLRKEAAIAIEKLFQLAKEDGIELFAVSGFRSYEYQKTIHENYIRTYGEEATLVFSAPPGHSEHQLGLAMDVTSASNDFALTEEFGETKEGQWLAANAHRAGFIVRYQKGQEHITGFSYEPWHIRYVGEIATEIYHSRLTLEEFFGLYP